MAARRADRRKAERQKKDRLADNLGPTKEQMRKGGIKRLPNTVLDDHGMIARPWRHRATLASLYEKDVISKDELAAGEAFRVRFRHAWFDTLAALDLGKVPGTFSPLVAGEHQIVSRDYVWSRICAFGGIVSLPGSCCWNVVGMERTLRSWALERALHDRPMDEREARGILRGVLALLAVDYNSIKWRPPVSRMHEDTVHVRTWLAPA
jgi:hypothetical protein